MTDQRQQENYGDPMRRQQLKATSLQQQMLRRKNNPENKPTGPYTGRCSHCGSTNLWDDNLAYGCRDCGNR